MCIVNFVLFTVIFTGICFGQIVNPGLLSETNDNADKSGVPGITFFHTNPLLLKESNLSIWNYSKGTEVDKNGPPSWAHFMPRYLPHALKLSRIQSELDKKNAENTKPSPTVVSAIPQYTPDKGPDLIVISMKNNQPLEAPRDLTPTQRSLFPNANVPGSTVRRVVSTSSNGIQTLGSSWGNNGNVQNNPFPDLSLPDAQSIPSPENKLGSVRSSEPLNIIEVEAVNSNSRPADLPNSRNPSRSFGGSFNAWNSNSNNQMVPFGDPNVRNTNQNNVLIPPGNTKASQIIPSSTDVNPNTSAAKQKPSIIVVSSFKDHRNKPYLKQVGDFVDTREQTDTVGDSSRSDTSLNGVVLPPVRTTSDSGIQTNQANISPVAETIDQTKFVDPNTQGSGGMSVTTVIAKTNSPTPTVSTQGIVLEPFSSTLPGKVLGAGRGSPQVNNVEQGIQASNVNQGLNVDSDKIPYDMNNLPISTVVSSTNSKGDSSQVQPTMPSIETTSGSLPGGVVLPPGSLPRGVVLPPGSLPRGVVLPPGSSKDDAQPGSGNILPTQSVSRSGTQNQGVKTVPLVSQGNAENKQTSGQGSTVIDNRGILPSKSGGNLNTQSRNTAGNPNQQFFDARSGQTLNNVNSIGQGSQQIGSGGVLSIPPNNGNAGGQSNQIVNNRGLPTNSRVQPIFPPNGGNAPSRADQIADNGEIPIFPNGNRNFRGQDGAITNGQGIPSFRLNRGNIPGQDRQAISGGGFPIIGGGNQRSNRGIPMVSQNNRNLQGNSGQFSNQNNLRPIIDRGGLFDPTIGNPEGSNRQIIDNGGLMDPNIGIMQEITENQNQRSNVVKNGPGRNAQEINSQFVNNMQRTNNGNVLDNNGQTEGQLVQSIQSRENNPITRSNTQGGNGDMFSNNINQPFGQPGTTNLQNLVPGDPIPNFRGQNQPFTNGQQIPGRILGSQIPFNGNGNQIRGTSPQNMRPPNPDMNRQGVMNQNLPQNINSNQATNPNFNVNPPVPFGSDMRIPPIDFRQFPPNDRNSQPSTAPNGFPVGGNTPGAIGDLSDNNGQRTNMPNNGNTDQIIIPNQQKGGTMLPGMSDSSANPNFFGKNTEMNANTNQQFLESGVNNIANEAFGRPGFGQNPNLFGQTRPFENIPQNQGRSSNQVEFDRFEGIIPRNAPEQQNRFNMNPNQPSNPIVNGNQQMDTNMNPNQFQFPNINTNQPFSTDMSSNPSVSSNLNRPLVPTNPNQDINSNDIPGQAPNLGMNTPSSNEADKMQRGFMQPIQNGMSPQNTNNLSTRQVNSQLNNPFVNGQFNNPVNSQQGNGQFNNPANGQEGNGQLNNPANGQQGNRQFNNLANGQQGNGQFNNPANGQQGNGQFNNPANDQQGNGQFNNPANGQQGNGQFNNPANSQQVNSQFNNPADGLPFSGQFNNPTNVQPANGQFNNPDSFQQGNPVNSQQGNNPFANPPNMDPANDPFNPSNRQPGNDQFSNAQNAQPGNMAPGSSQNLQNGMNVNGQQNRFGNPNMQQSSLSTRQQMSRASLGQGRFNGFPNQFQTRPGTQPIQNPFNRIPGPQFMGPNGMMRPQQMQVFNQIPPNFRRFQGR